MQKLTPRTLALALEYHLFKKDKALLKPLVPAKMQAVLRRRARARYLVWDARRYNVWMKTHLAARRFKYAADLEPGLLSIATPVWDGTPIRYLRLLAESVARQNTAGACEWFVLDNGCNKPDVLRYLHELAKQFTWVTLHHAPKNEGIVGGLRVCLERANGRYLCVVDSDDLIYPDCLQIVQWWIRESGFPPLLYSDEDKLIETQPVQPYFKPDFDPVLLLNSAYIAHLGVIERAKALELGAYTDRNAEGSPDWDCFVRFYTAGYEAVHIPEVIYSWRMHPESTADDAGSKPYIHSSQQAVIGRYLKEKKLEGTYVLKYSPLLPGTADFWIERQPINPVKVQMAGDPGQLDYPGLSTTTDGELICVLQSGLQPARRDCLWEAQGLLERYPDAVMVGGWVADQRGAVADGPLVLGFDGSSGCPDEGRPVVDPGYFTQMRKQRSVSAITSRFAVIRSEFLKDALANGGFPELAMEELGPWLGKYALEKGKRVIFSPFLRCDAAGDTAVKFGQQFPPAALDNRYYPLYFGSTNETAYQLKLRE
jgi:glycosyltransferase involved in cell wall biosynthesis